MSASNPVADEELVAAGLAAEKKRGLEKGAGDNAFYGDLNADLGADVSTGFRDSMNSVGKLFHRVEDSAIAELSQVKIALLGPQSHNSMARTSTEVVDVADDSMQQSRSHRDECSRMFKMSWNDDLAPISNGCVDDYFQKAHSSIRIAWPGINKGQDLVEELRVGISVLHYGKHAQCFERKLLKADEELRFLYLMTPPPPEGKPKVRSAEDKKTKAPPVTVPLGHIRRIFAMADALHICEKNGLDSKDLELDTTFVLLVDHAETEREKPVDLDGDPPDMDHIVILVCSLERKLSDYIQRVKDFSDGIETGDSTHHMRVDTVGLVEHDELLDKEAISFKFDISYRNEKVLRTVHVFSEHIDSQDLGGVMKKLTAELLPSDLARVRFVIQDAVALRRCLTTQLNEIAVRGVMRFVNDWSRIQRALGPDVNLADPIEEAEALNRVSEDHSTENANAYYQEVGTRAVLKCLKLMFEVEKDAQALVYNTDKSDEEGDDDKETKPQRKPSQDLGPTSFALSETKWKCAKCGFIGLTSNKVVKGELTYFRPQACDICGAPSDAVAEGASTAADIDSAAADPSAAAPPAGAVPPLLAAASAAAAATAADAAAAEVTAEAAAADIGTEAAADVGAAEAAAAGVASAAVQEVLAERPDSGRAALPMPSIPENAEAAQPGDQRGFRTEIVAPPSEPSEGKRGGDSVFACGGAGVCAKPERGKNAKDAKDDCSLQ